ncbi:MAG: repair protein RecN [Thermomicrobiales bacterium]|nr:repair protein RecN [Thermomicrobiales bacterium]
MLLELAITDFAIIDELRIPFEPGLNVLTGETGAGKSIIIDALGAVLGERVGSDVVRTGSRVARIEATFDVSTAAQRADLAAVFDELGVEAEEGVLIFRREIASGGRSTARINGRAATAGMLSRLGGLLVDIHGQSDHLSLLRASEHLDVLDRFAGLIPERAAFADLVREWRSVRDRIDAIVTGARDRAQRVDLLEFQAREIDAAALRPGEEEELVAERSVLANAERLMEDAATAYGLLSGESDELDVGASAAALPVLRRASAQLAEIATLDATMQPLAARAEEVVYLLEDVAAETRTYRDSIEADPARLETVEERLDLVKRLKRKYGSTVDEIIAFGEEAARELESLTGGEVDLDSLRHEEEQLLNRIGEAAVRLSRARSEAAGCLSRETEEAIAVLNMGRSRFAVSITQVPSAQGVRFESGDGAVQTVAFDETGADRVEFLLAPNAGEALKPLARVASGGEMARLMLALKSILSAADATPTLVFDEVDVGVGGRSGQVVGEKLWGLSSEHQVLVITHLPQIAAFGTAHFRIAKGERDGRTVTQVRQIADDDRIDELAAMLDGEPVTQASRANARQMLRRVRTWIGEESRSGSLVNARSERIASD